MKKVLFLLGALTLVFTACGSSSQASKAPVGGLITPLDELSYDWGDVNIEGGEVEHSFHFRNDGAEDLLLKGAMTSCMCTSATFELPDGSLSPAFGMHGGKPWNYSIKPGETFELDVVFDPMAHGPDAVGPVQRAVSITSSAKGGLMEVSLQADVLSKKDFQSKYANSDFVFTESEFDFGVIKQSGGVVSHSFPFKYLGQDPLEVTALPASCGCTSATISQKIFKTGDTGFVTVYFDPNLHEEPEGKFFKTVTLLTDPKLEKQPELKIWAEIDLDLGPDAYKLKEDHDE